MALEAISDDINVWRNQWDIESNTLIGVPSSNVQQFEYRNIESSTVIQACSSNVKRNRLLSIRRKQHLDVEQQVSESMFEIRGMHQQPVVTQVCVAIDWSIFKHRNYTPISLHRSASVLSHHRLTSSQTASVIHTQLMLSMYWYCDIKYLYSYMTHFPSLFCDFHKDRFPVAYLLSFSVCFSSW